MPVDVQRWQEEEADKCSPLRRNEHLVTVHRHPKGFVGICTEAYNRHHHLILDPNAVWLSILSQFAIYVELHAEELRGKFVHRTRKTKLELNGMGTLQMADFGALSEKMVRAMGFHLRDDAVQAWAIPDFSTTTDTDRAVGAMMLMGTMQRYFEYGMNLSCGLPAVTLTGSVEDWQNVLSGV